MTDDIYASAEEYARWIRDPEHWGGAIELSILARHFQIVLSCVCIQTLRVDHYGQGNGYPNRALLLYYLCYRTAAVAYCSSRTQDLVRVV